MLAEAIIIFVRVSALICIYSEFRAFSPPVRLSRVARGITAHKALWEFRPHLHSSLEVDETESRAELTSY